jgi:histidinol phosphatase-like enzyme (inositol monophosphatase family)
VAASFSCPQEFIDLAHKLADAAGDVVRPYFRSGLQQDDKSDQTPVTIADRNAERTMRDILSKVRPQDGVHGEEFGDENVGAEFVWALDPIDGTKAFITGKQMFGTLIALLRNGEPVLGIIDQPVLRERWIGGHGCATTFNGKPVRTRSCANLKSAVANLTTPKAFRGPREELEPYRKIDLAARTTAMGGDCIAYGLLASGFIDVIVEHDLQLHDFAAVIPVIEGAGGIVTDWKGQRMNLHSPGDTLACGDARVHAEAVALIR